MRLRILLPMVALASVALAIPRPALADATTDSKKVCSDAYGQAQTLRDAHKLRAARDQLRACSQATCKGFILQDCTTWLGDVEARIPSVVVVATDATGAVLPNVSVSVDGEAALRKVDGTSWDVDPGQHTFTFVLADGTRVDKPVIVLEGQKGQRVTATVAAPQAAPASVPVVVSPVVVPSPIGTPLAAAHVPAAPAELRVASPLASRGAWSAGARPDPRRYRGGRPGGRRDLRRAGVVVLELGQQRVPERQELLVLGDQRPQQRGDVGHRVERGLHRRGGAGGRGADRVLHGAEGQGADGERGGGAG